MFVARLLLWVRFLQLNAEFRESPCKSLGWDFALGHWNSNDCLFVPLAVATFSVNLISLQSFPGGTFEHFDASPTDKMGVVQLLWPLTSLSMPINAQGTDGIETGTMFSTLFV